MTLLGQILIFILPGSVLAIHQGVDHWRGAHVPQLIILGWKMPYWLFYPAVVLTGPLLMLLILGQMIAKR